MKALAIFGLLAVAMLAGCTSSTDEGEQFEEETPRVVQNFELPETVSDMEFVAQADVGNVRGIWVEDSYAYLTGGPGLRIVDVADPANPVMVADAIEDTEQSRDVELIHHPNGNTYALLARDSLDMVVVDVTDPASPEVVTLYDVGLGHNLVTIPGTTLAYISHSIKAGATSATGNAGVTIVDLAVPEAPVSTQFNFPAVATTVGGVPKPVTATTCHDIKLDMDKNWATCAGVTETHVWDISDPAAPEIIQVIANPLTNIHHGAWLVQNSTVLIIGDEFAGAAAGPVCNDSPQPYAALWFFDISDLMTPLPAGQFQIEYSSAGEQNTALCTTHFGGPVEERELFVLAWYTAGTVLIDYSDIMFPSQVAHHRPDGDLSTWDSVYSNGHVFTGDSARGMDVLKLI